jgi:hypothetical protein
MVMAAAGQLDIIWDTLGLHRCLSFLDIAIWLNLDEEGLLAACAEWFGDRCSHGAAEQ